MAHTRERVPDAPGRDHAGFVSTCEHDPCHEDDQPAAEDAEQRVAAPRRHLREQQHPDDQRQRRQDLEQTVGEHAAEQCRPEAVAPRQPPRDHADAGNLADSARQDAVGEDADEEGGEDVERPWMRRGDGLDEDRAPGKRPGDRRAEVERDRGERPAPAHRRERVADCAPVRAAEGE